MNDGYTSSKQLSQDIINKCKDILPEYMIPEVIEYRTDLPRTERGKVDYRALEKEMAAS